MAIKYIRFLMIVYLMIEEENGKLCAIYGYVRPIARDDDDNDDKESDLDGDVKVITVN